MHFHQVRPQYKEKYPVVPSHEIIAVEKELRRYGITAEIIGRLNRLEYFGYVSYIHLYDINNTRPKQRKNKAPNTSIKGAISWLKDRISFLCYGRKTKDGTPKPVRKKKTLIRNYNDKQLPRLTDWMLKKHLHNQETLYFWADHRQSTEEILFLVDIDALKARGEGSKQGAIDFANYLIRNYFPNAYMELSTHGNGVHLFLVMRKQDIPNEHVRKSLKHLDAWLKYIAKDIKADIEEVEIKVHPPIVQYDGTKLVDMTYGQLAKIPRELSTRLSELEMTYRCTPADLLELKIPEAYQKVTKGGGQGSVSGKLISDEEIGNLARYKEIGMKLLNNELPLSSDKRHAITWDDVAVMILILKYNFENPQPGNSLSSKLIEGWWRALFTAGDVPRGYHASRIKPVRDALSDNGFINWISNDYQYGYRNSNGDYVKGVSCKWAITDELHDILTAEKQEASSISTAISNMKNEYLQNIKRADNPNYEIDDSQEMFESFAMENQEASSISTDIPKINSGNKGVDNFENEHNGPQLSIDIFSGKTQEASSISTEMGDGQQFPIIRPRWSSNLVNPQWQREREWLYSAEKLAEETCYAA